MPDKSPAYYVTWKDEEGKASALATFSEAAAREYATGSGRFRDVAPRTSVRDEVGRQDYDFFRPGESIPTADKDVEVACMQCYDAFSVVRNVIDMMSDFVVKGIDVVHPSLRVQTFGREWFRKAKAQAVSGKIATMLYLAGAAPVERTLHRLDAPVIEALRNADPDTAGRGARRYEIPFSYRVLNPATVEAQNADEHQYQGKPLKYAVRIPTSAAKRLSEDKVLSLSVDESVRQALRGDRLVPLSSESVEVLHYKKHDFQIWSRPMLYPMLDDLRMLTKLKQADRSALDGVISQVRLWKLGSLEHQIIPGAPVIDLLRDILLNASSGGVMDLVWGPDIELVETSTASHQFLGNAKYVPTMAAIYQGLGVPPTLTGVGGDSGFTNNFVSLKILVERLEYCRTLLVAFWEGELARVQAVFGFRQPFRLVFDVPSLSDDSAEKKLLIDLADRNVISNEMLVERFGGDPDIEEARVRREERRRAAGALPAKAGNFHADSREKSAMRTALLTNGLVVPSQVGLKLDPADPEEGDPPGLAGPAAPPDGGGTDKKGGRPPGAKDSVKRKGKLAGPTQNSGAELAAAAVWAGAAQAAVDESLREPFLRSKGKANARQLSAAEAADFEGLKFAALAALASSSPLLPVTPEAIHTLLRKLPPVPAALAELRRQALSTLADPTLDDARRAEAAAAALWAAAGGVQDD